MAVLRKRKVGYRSLWVTRTILASDDEKRLAARRRGDNERRRAHRKTCRIVASGVIEKDDFISRSEILRAGCHGGRLSRKGGDGGTLGVSRWRRAMGPSLSL